jgi:hypothetical protein
MLQQLNEETLESIPKPQEGCDDTFDGLWLHLSAMGDVFGTEPPPPKYLLRRALAGEVGSAGIFPLGKVGMLQAAGGAGKTMALCQLALSVTTGTSWLNTFTTPNPGRVLLALGEEDQDEVRRRLYYAARSVGLDSKAKGLVMDRLVVLPLAGVPVPLVENDIL